MYINLICPPMPHLIVGGVSIFRQGDKHGRRQMKYNAFDLIYVYKGCLYMEENGKKYDVSEGDFMILLPGHTHKGYRCCKSDTVFYWIHFFTTGEYSFSESRTMCRNTEMNSNKYYEKDTFTISIPQFGEIDQKYRTELKRYMEKITQVKIDNFHQKKQFTDGTVSQIDLQILFLQIIRILCDSDFRTEEKDLAEEINFYFLDNYMEQITLNELSRRFMFHPVYITRCVKKKYNLTPQQLLTKIRMEHAAQLLEETHLHVNLIGQSVGYPDAAYFSKQFKKYYGMTAKEYRNIHINSH